MTTRLLTALTATALLALPASAHAQGATPTPGCQGIQITDKAGDSSNSTTAATGQSPTGNPSTDVIAGWITYDGTKAFANIQVDNLTEGEVDPPYVAVGWEMMMNTTAGAKYVRAYVDRTGIPRWTWGSENDPLSPQSAGPSGATTGTMFPGKNGVIQIELPLGEADFGAKPGSQLKGLGLEVRQWASTPSAVPHTGLPLVFPAPIYDTAAGKAAFTLGPCPATPGPGAPGGPPAPAPVEPAPAAPSAPATGTFDVKVTVPKLSAKKLKKARKFTVKLRGNATELTAVVRKSVTGGKALAAGKLAALKGSGKLTLKKAKLKKGTYVLVFTGKNAQGQAAEGAVKFKVR